MRRLLAAAGFGRIRVVPLPPQPEVRGPALFVATAVLQEDGRRGDR
jgi:hypothetical protein